MNQMTNKELFTTFLPEEKTEALFNHFKGLRRMARAPHEEFLEVGLDKHDIKQVRAVLELSRKYAARTPEIKKINNAKDTYALLAPLMQDSGSRGNPLHTAEQASWRTCYPAYHHGYIK
ncbi:MAG: hypothetical protein ACOX57_08870 [Limnochordia bacterium]